MKVAAYFSGLRRVAEVDERRPGDVCERILRGGPPARSCDAASIRGAVASIKGPRDNNEDSAAVAIREHGGRTYVLVAVADGVGGMERGEVASALAVCEVLRQFSTYADQGEDWLRQVFEAAHEAVRRKAKGGATTLSVGLLSLPEGDLFVGNVGDSPLYLIHVGGPIYDMTPERDEEAGYITQAVGHPTYRGPHIQRYAISALSDLVVLGVTDGVDDFIDRSYYGYYTGSPRGYVCTLISQVRSRTRDNATAVAVYVNRAAVSEHTRRIYIPR